VLTQEDIREVVLNARSHFTPLGVVPIINENDTVVKRSDSGTTINFLVANLVDADLLIILTDLDGLFTADPRKTASLSFPSSRDHGHVKVWGDSSGVGVGGMSSKISAK
jgi:glutamate 5-kinase